MLMFRFGDYELCPERYELIRHGNPVKLEPRVLEVLAHLVTHRERVVRVVDINAAQPQAREPLFAVAPAASGAVEAVGSAATRPYATTRASHGKSSARKSARTSYEGSGVI